MASIAEWINKIKTAIYGEEVRGAIWQSLEAMNTEVEAINVDEDQIQTNKTNIAANTAAIIALNSSFAVTDITAQIRADSSYISVSALDVKKCGHIVYASIEFSVTQEIPAYTVILSNFPQSIPPSNVIIGYELNNNVFHSFYMKGRNSLAPRAKIPNGAKMLIYLNYLT